MTLTTDSTAGERGCCDLCDGLGGSCWQCRGTGHCHAPDPTCATPAEPDPTAGEQEVTYAPHTGTPFEGRYPACALDANGNCHRWNHDHEQATPAEPDPSTGKRTPRQPTAWSYAEPDAGDVEALAEDVLDAMESLGIEDATMTDARIIAENLTPRLDAVRRKAGEPMTPAEQSEMRKAYERDRWAGEWNSLPTAVDRLLADRAARIARESR